MDISTLYLLVAIIGCIVGVSGWLRNTKIDTGQESAAIQKLQTQVIHLLEEIEDLKIQLRLVQDDVKEALEIGLSARSSASAAHDRLDCIGMLSSYECRKLDKNYNESGKTE